MASVSRSTFFTGRDKDLADTERTRSVLKELAPDFTDAVVKGSAVNPHDLQRVATPELLDSIATNVLALRLGDQSFAKEIYADIRDQAIRAPERPEPLHTVGDEQFYGVDTDRDSGQ